MPFSKILHVFQTSSQVALFILPISNRRPLLISPEFNSGSKRRSLGWMPSNNAYIVWHLLYPKSFIHLPKYYSAPSRHQNPFGNTYKIEFMCQICKNITKISIFLQKYLHNSKISCNFAKKIQIRHLK